MARGLEQFLTIVEKGNEAVNHLVWGPAMLGLFLAVGILFTIQTRAFQIRGFFTWMRVTMRGIFRRKGKNGDSTESVSQFQSLCTALAGTMGVGNISGVAFALTAGGPGAVFWMWVSALFGMMTSYAEKVLAIRYRYRTKDGRWMGGAMVTMERGLGLHVIPKLFCLFCIFASFGIGNMSQGNQIAKGLEAAFQIPGTITGVVLLILVGLVIVGGLQRIASVTQIMIPFMSILYVLFASIILIVFWYRIDDAFFMIFRDAFCSAQSTTGIVGGVAGYTISCAIRSGIARGVFSNEAGLGSSVMVHASAEVKEPVEQGMWGILEIFVDTIVVCTLTALVILVSGVYNPSVYGRYAGQILPTTLSDGIQLTSQAFGSVLGNYGEAFIVISIFVFAFATMLGWSYYGERATEYVFGKKGISWYRRCFIVLIFIGCVTGAQTILCVSDTLNGLMALPNLITLLLLSGEVRRLTKDYFTRDRT